MAASIQRHRRLDATLLRRIHTTLEELYRRTNAIRVSSSRGSNKDRKLSCLSTWRGGSRNITAVLQASAYINCTLTGHNHLVSHSRITNSPFYFIFLQLCRAQQQRHSRIHSHYCLIISIDDRTFQRVRGEETFIIITIIHRVTLLRPNANRRLEGRASEGVRPAN